jgi:hypothetical protein
MKFPLYFFACNALFILMKGEFRCRREMQDLRREV